MLAKSGTVFSRLGILMLVALPLACESSSPVSPSATAVPGSGMPGAVGASVSETAAEDGSSLKVSAPIPQSPIGNVDVETLTPTLTVQNAVPRFVSGLALKHQFQVHRVAVNGSLTMVDSKTVPQGSPMTSYTVETFLADDTLYQWQVRAVFQGAQGPWSSAAGFRTNVPVQILKPTLLQPAPGEVVNTVRPIMEVLNPKIEGDAGPVLIEFQVASDPSFQNIVSVTSEEMGKHAGIDTALTGPRQTVFAIEEKTSAQPSLDLDLEGTYFWRARGTNGSVDRFAAAAAAPGTVIGEFSDSSSFAIASDARSFGDTGGGTEFDGGGDELDLSEVVWLHQNVSSWPQTSTIISASIGNPPMCINHTKLAQWPRADFSTSGVIVDSNAWVFGNINGTWYAATWEWFIPGEICKGLTVNDFQTHVGGLAPLNTWVPGSGEQIGFMVSTPARHGNGPVNERSNVVLLRVP